MNLECCIIFVIGWILGIFTAMFLYGWEDEKDDIYSGIIPIKNIHLSSRYAARAMQYVIKTRCSYCRVDTYSIYCERHKVYYCTAHSFTKHKNCQHSEPSGTTPKYFTYPSQVYQRGKEEL